MKKLLTKIIITLSFIILLNTNILTNTYAADEAASWIKIVVWEKVYWANCIEIDSKWEPWKAKEGETQMYECNVAKWFWAVTVMLWKMIKYFTYIAALGWVLFIIINGILYSMWWAEQSLKDEAKKRITATLTWLVLLFVSWIILNLIAPWIYI